MKQMLGFCALGLVTVVAITVFGLATAFKDFNSDDFLERVNEVIPIDQVEIVEEDDTPQVGWNVLAHERVARRIVMDWKTIEPENDEWNFDSISTQLKNSNDEYVAVLFSDELASPSPPWSLSFDPQIDEDAEDYVRTVVTEYADQITYWQIADKMDLWRPEVADQVPPVFFIDQQASFFRRVSEIIRQNDPDAIVLMPGVSTLSSYTLDEWFAGVVRGGASWFDVVTYHYSSDAKSYAGQRDVLGLFLELRGLQDRPVWLLSEPSTVSVVAQAYGSGDKMVAWHEQDGAMQLFVDQFVPFSDVEELSRSFNGTNVYKFTLSDGIRYIVWGEGKYQIPADVDQMIPLVADEVGLFEVIPLEEEQVITLTPVPTILSY